MVAQPSALVDRDSHFEFGKNWADFSRLIDDERLELSTQSVKRLVPHIRGKTFLDIGSGSGLFSLAALRLGAARVVAVDIDENSVATTKRVLSEHAPELSWHAEQKSVFDLSPDQLGQFDVVYSWGVLHHTGDMWRAVECASRMVAPGGTFAFALYEKTPLCGFWRIEKRAYMRAGQRTQRMLCGAYKAAYQAARILSGRGLKKGPLTRGMNTDNDIHDWLGGFPYESTDREEVRQHLMTLGFEPVLEEPVKIHLAGVFGSGCSEYVYKRSSQAMPVAKR